MTLLTPILARPPALNLDGHQATASRTPLPSSFISPSQLQASPDGLSPSFINDYALYGAHQPYPHWSNQSETAWNTTRPEQNVGQSYSVSQDYYDPSSQYQYAPTQPTATDNFSTLPTDQQITFQRRVGIPRFSSMTEHQIMPHSSEDRAAPRPYQTVSNPAPSASSSRHRDPLASSTHSELSAPSASRPLKRSQATLSRPLGHEHKRARLSPSSDDVEEIDLATEEGSEQKLLGKERTELVKTQQGGDDDDGPKSFGKMSCIICLDNFTNLTATACGMFALSALLLVLPILTTNADWYYQLQDTSSATSV